MTAQAKRLESFMPTFQKTDAWLEDLMRELGTEQPAVAYRALRASLHALRDQLLPTEAAHLAAQLPMLIRGLYYEGWHPADKPRRERKLDDFLLLVSRELMPETDPPPRDAAQAVFRLLQQRVSEGEIRDVCQMLPEDIRSLWP